MKIPFPQSTYVASAILGEPLGRRVVSIEVRPPTEAEKKIGGHGLTVGDIMWSFGCHRENARRNAAGVIAHLE